MEIILQGVGELLFELGIRSLREPFREQRRSHPLLSLLGLVLMGALAGWITCLAWPGRLLDPPPLKGLSLLISPLINGLLMELYGRWREGRGEARTYISTFWGGGLFALSMATVRFLCVVH